MPGTSDADFEAYLDELFRAVAPGDRIVIGVADEVPPSAVFSRLQRIGERIEKEGRLPLQAGAFRPAPVAAAPAAVAAGAASTAASGDEYDLVRQDVFKGKHRDIVKHVQELLERGVAPGDILERGLISAISVVGERMASGAAFIPEVLLAARAMAAAVDVLAPRLAQTGEQQRGRVLIGTVSGDMHDVGKNLVVTMLRGVGFEVRDLGINVPREKFFAEIAEFQPDVLGLSSLLTTTMSEMRAIVAGVKERGLGAQCKVIVGGAPVSAQFAAQIGADGYAPNSVEAVRLVKRLAGERAAAAATA
jgi:5-methyltetrahydrofolate--homocysteine methyltransferase